jgi:glycosyltransferase involved in cell wall biosynthesis
MNSFDSAPLISIAVCTYNGERYLAEQINSLLSQTWSNFEIIVVDDNSLDGTLEILKNFVAKDSRIKLHCNSKNLGIIKNFSLCMSLCRGKFIAPCDQDDIWHPEKLTKLHGVIGSHILAYCDSELISENGDSLNMRISDRLNMYEGNDPTVFTFWNCISGHAMLFERSLLDMAIPMPEVKFHDWWLAFIAATFGEIKYLNEPLVQYRQHANSQTDLSRTGQKKDSGNRKRLFIERGEWIQQLAKTPSLHKTFFVELHRLWLNQTNEWISVQIVRHLAKKSGSLLFINKNRSFMRFALKHIWGLKAKVFVNPSKYSDLV